MKTVAKLIKRVFLLTLLLLVGGGLYLSYRVRAAPDLGGVDFKKETPVRQEQRRVEARKLEEQVREVAKSAEKRERKRFAISATAEELNTLLQDRIQTKNLPVRDLKLGLQPDTVLLQGFVEHNGFSGIVTAQGKLRAQNGKAQLEIESLKLGGVEMPGNLRAKVERELAPKINEALNRAPGRIDNVKVEKDRLTLEGQTD